MNKIAAFIEARYDELQQAAELAPSSPGVPVPTESPGRWRLGIVFGTVFDGETTVAKARTIPLAHHIALNDPQFILDDIAAKRLILDDHGDQHGCVDRRGADYPYVGCRTLRALALPFARHSDYDPAWKVSEHG